MLGHEEQTSGFIVEIEDESIHSVEIILILHPEKNSFGSEDAQYHNNFIKFLRPDFTFKIIHRG